MNHTRFYIEIFKDPDHGCGYYYCENARKVKEDFSHWLSHSDKLEGDYLKLLPSWELPSDISEWELYDDTPNDYFLFYDRCKDNEVYPLESLAQNKTMYYSRYELHMSRIHEFNIDDYRKFLK